MLKFFSDLPRETFNSILLFLCTLSAQAQRRELHQLFDLNYETGGGEVRAELLGKIRPLWEKLNDLHAEKSPHFAEVFAKSTFLQRKELWAATAGDPS